MAKMRYSEMPRDVSCDSLSTLRIVENHEDSDGGRCLDKSPLSDVETLVPAFNGNDFPLLKKKETTGTDSRHHKSYIRPKDPTALSTGDISKRISHHPVRKQVVNPPCYDNYGSLPHCAAPHAKSQSLPSNTSIKSYDSVVFDPLRVAPEDFASQLTLLDMPAFRGITPEELVSCGWNKKHKLTVAPNVVAFTRRFNHVSFWTVQEILNGPSAKQRAETLGHFIRIAKKLYDLNNLHSLFAIISALQSVSVYRLSKTWACLSKKEKQTFDRLAEVFSDRNNWHNLRDLMESLKLPCIPYLGLFLTDLTYIDMAHPHSGGLESEQRRLKMNNILRVISDYQQSDYSHLVHLPHIQNYLRNVRYIEELQKFVEDDQYKLSLKLEPPSPGPSSSSSKESVSETMTSVASLNLSPAKGLSSGSLRLQATAAGAAKFVPTHRKCRSLGTNIFNKSPQVVTYREATSVLQRGEKHLLDDSVLEEQQQQQLIHHNRESPNGRHKHVEGTVDEEGEKLLTRHGSSLLPDPDDFGEAVGMQCVLQGCLRRKTMLKAGRKPAVTSWQRYWVQLWATYLVYYPPKSFKGSERSDFKQEPCKTVPIGGWSVFMGDNPFQPDLFQLTDPNRGNVYKCRAGSKAAAQQWFRHLQQAACGIKEKPLPANLMSFE
ncbi:ras-specific guanine nucleotide-releasing factor RalGPS2 isoform X2 [Zootermopsis nevadensis]|uniref:ras-specific guanine nucleotide-releasing factor RalGPS2 isoform X2 n=1 Tax=Zootermopsis nevadensis TaxID=136037 RepID=UPI000B8E21FF|nr:ras-specific guanine nucleotide-releasing factor RalGPS2 isoform X2 [Zootermopsis nevadensis]